MDFKKKFGSKRSWLHRKAVEFRNIMASEFRVTHGMINPCDLKVPTTRKLRAPEFGKTAHGSVAAMSPLKCPSNPQALGRDFKRKT
jgi:hypothetical protein